MDNLVDVMMPVYNHEKYLSKAIEGIVTQKANFKFRLVIGDDCSKDNSRAIISKYAAEYPDIIFPVFNEKNLGASGNGNNLNSLANAKYIAMCEGDDYWTDPYKLQKQIDFLEANPDFSICFSEIEVLDEIGNYVDAYPRKDGDVYTIEDFILTGSNIIPTPTLVFRNILPKPLPAFYLEAYSGDIFMQIYLGHHGKAKFLSEKTAVYRHHTGGMTKSIDTMLNSDRALAKLFGEMNEYLDYKYDAIFRKRLFEMSKIKLVFGARDKKGIVKVKHYFKSIPEYFKYSDKVNIKELLYYHMVLFFPRTHNLVKKYAKK